MIFVCFLVWLRLLIFTIRYDLISCVFQRNDVY